jgi:hypothetical protein
MRFGLVLVALGGLGLAPMSVEAQDISPEGAARAASVQSAIVQFCGAYHLINGPKAAQLSAGARQVALKIYPQGRGQAEVDREFRRRLKEVEVTGPKYWCQYQREVQKSLNTGVYLD